VPTVTSEASAAAGASGLVAVGKLGGQWVDQAVTELIQAGGADITTSWWTDALGGAAHGVSNVASVATGALSWTQSLGTALSWLTNKQNLMRVGEFVLGALLTILGLVLFVATSKPGQQAITTGAEVAAVA
jgi:hypothetical protein